MVFQKMGLGLDPKLNLSERLNALEARFNEQSQQMQEMRVNLHKSQTAWTKKYNQLLLGSVAFNFINASTLFVFGRAKYKHVRNKMHSFADLESEPKDALETEQWEKCKSKYWCNDMFDEIIERLKADRLEYAHPTTITDESDDVPTPNQLQAMVHELYNNKNERAFRTATNELINSLAELTQDIRRPLLTLL
jgi:hypothetical protein